MKTHFLLRPVRLVMLASLLVGGPFSLRAAPIELRPFDAKSPAAIREAHIGRPFVLAFWSIHCAPCAEELPALAALQRKYPGIPIVLVAADPPSAKVQVLRTLEAQKLDALESWAFADEFAERVRFAVDRAWQGELPRTYFFDAKHEVVAHSGVVDSAWLKAWFEKTASSLAKSKSFAP